MVFVSGVTFTTSAYSGALCIIFSPAKAVAPTATTAPTTSPVTIDLSTQSSLPASANSAPYDRDGKTLCEIVVGHRSLTAPGAPKRTWRRLNVAVQRQFRRHTVRPLFES